MKRIFATFFLMAITYTLLFSQEKNKFRYLSLSALVFKTSSSNYALERKTNGFGFPTVGFGWQLGNNSICNITIPQLVFTNSVATINNTSSNVIDEKVSQRVLGVSFDYNYLIPIKNSKISFLIGGGSEIAYSNTKIEYKPAVNVNLDNISKTIRLSIIPKIWYKINDRCRADLNYHLFPIEFVHNSNIDYIYRENFSFKNGWKGKNWSSSAMHIGILFSI
jgi:hypothetical protein